MMKSLAPTVLISEIAGNSLARLAGRLPRRRRARAAHWLARAIPVAVALVAAGAAARKLRDRRAMADGAVRPARGAKRVRPAQTAMPRDGAMTAAQAVEADLLAGHAPDPRRHYASPEDLREDIALDLATRRSLLEAWKDEVNLELEAESEGMGSSDPIHEEAEARLAAEERRVSKALSAVMRDTAARPH